jgi:hypothetical protein
MLWLKESLHGLLVAKVGFVEEEGKFLSKWLVALRSPDASRHPGLD